MSEVTTSCVGNQNNLATVRNKPNNSKSIVICGELFCGYRLSCNTMLPYHFVRMCMVAVLMSKTASIVVGLLVH